MPSRSADRADVGDGLVQEVLHPHGGVAATLARHPLQRCREERRAPAAVAAGGAETGDLALEHHDPGRGVGRREVVGRPQPGVARPDDHDIDLDVPLERGARCEVVVDGVVPQAQAPVVGPRWGHGHGGSMHPAAVGVKCVEDGFRWNARPSTTDSEGVAASRAGLPQTSPAGQDAGHGLPRPRPPRLAPRPGAGGLHRGPPPLPRARRARPRPHARRRADELDGQVAGRLPRLRRGGGRGALHLRRRHRPRRPLSR